jgi:hypothetical protein
MPRKNDTRNLKLSHTKEAPRRDARKAVRLIEADAGERDDGGLEGVEAHLRGQIESQLFG